MGQFTDSVTKIKNKSKKIRRNKSLSRDVAFIARYIELSRALTKKDIYDPGYIMLTQNNVRDQRVTGDGVVLGGQKRMLKWPPVANQNFQKSAKPIKNWTTTNKVGDQDAISRVVPELTQIFLEKRMKVKSRESKHGSREKKKGNDSKKGSGKKKTVKSKGERPNTSEKHNDLEKIVYNEDDRQNRLKKSYFVKSNELPYQNAAGFAKLMKELKDRFNNRPPTENRGEIDTKIIIQSNREKIDNARKRLYSFLDRKPTELKIQNVSKQRVRIFSSCEIRNDKISVVGKTSTVTTKSTQHFEEKSSSQRKIRSIFNPESVNKPQISKLEDIKEPGKRSSSARKKFRAKVKKFEVSGTFDPSKSRENLNSKIPEKRFTSSNGNSRIYFYKKNLPFIEERNTVSNSLDPNQFRDFINKIENSRQKSIDNLIQLDNTNLNKKEKTKWILDENRSWKKVTT